MKMGAFVNQNMMDITMTTIRYNKKKKYHPIIEPHFHFQLKETELQHLHHVVMNNLLLPMNTKAITITMIAATATAA